MVLFFVINSKSAISLCFQIILFLFMAEYIISFLFLYTNMNKKKHIAKVPLFAELPEKDLKILETIVIERMYRKGESIFSEGEEANGFYIVIAGRIKIFKLSPEGKEQIIHIFGPGEPFGEVAVFAGKSFPANAQALENSKVYFFARKAFVSLIRENPSLAMNMLAVLSLRLRKLTLMIENLSLKEVPGRLAAYLLYLKKEKSGSDRITLDIGKGQLASFLGTTAETLSRILTKMTRQNLISLDGPSITIIDSKGLKELSRSETLLSKT
jgi:CRP-like cAMP-binding protein